MDQPPDIGVALGLGMVQGTTEFLPVSSSGHLAAFGLFADVPELSIAWIVLLHASTLLATVCCFRNELWLLLRSLLDGVTRPSEYGTTAEGLLLRNLMLASVPTAAIGLWLKPHLDSYAHLPWMLGLGFLASAVAALSTRGRSGQSQRLSVMGAIVVGIAQGIAVLPGVSRSGTTIAVAMALGLEPAAAFRFSFLLSIPIIAAAAVLELGGGDMLAGMSSTVWLAAAVTFVVGYASLKLLGRVVSKGQFWLFALYLVPLGIGMLGYHFMGGAG